MIGRFGIAGKKEGDLLKVKIVSARKLYWPALLGCCLALWLAGCAPRIYETPYLPPPPPPKPAPPPAVTRPIFYVAASRLNLRGCAGMDCPKISVLEQNEIVEKIGEMDDWVEVIVRRDGRRGWVSSRHLSTEPVTPAPEAAPPAPPPFAPAPAPVEKPAPVKPPVVEKPKPVKPGEAPAPPKKKPEAPPSPAKPWEPAVKPAPKPAPAAEKPAPAKPEPVKEKPLPAKEKPAPPKEPEPEQPKKIRIM